MQGDDKEYMIPVDSEVYGEILELSKEVKLYYAKPLFSVKGKMENAGTGILTIRFGVDYARTIDLFEYGKQGHYSDDRTVKEIWITEDDCRALFQGLRDILKQAEEYKRADDQNESVTSSDAEQTDGSSGDGCRGKYYIKSISM